MGSKKSKSLGEIANDLQAQVIKNDDLNKLMGGTGSHKISKGNEGCGGILPQ